MLRHQYERHPAVRGVRRWRPALAGHRLMRRGGDSGGGRRRSADNLLESTDKNFRPVDLQIGPDGALWFGDWCNALIGHMQYSQRDPNRDHQHGRIYRLVYKDRPLIEPVTQHGKSEGELLEQLREYEPRTRYRARRELYDRPTEMVVRAVKQWVSALDASDPEYERLRCEALWVLQSHHAVDESLLEKVLQSKSPEARAAATHLVADEREYLPKAFDMLQRQVADEHPRVRLEAIRGLSFFPTMEAVDAALARSNHRSTNGSTTRWSTRSAPWSPCGARRTALAHWRRTIGTDTTLSPATWPAGVRAWRLSGTWTSCEIPRPPAKPARKATHRSRNWTATGATAGPYSGACARRATKWTIVATISAPTSRTSASGSRAAS